MQQQRGIVFRRGSHILHENLPEVEQNQQIDGSTAPAPQHMYGYFENVQLGKHLH